MKKYQAIRPQGQVGKFIGNNVYIHKCAFSSLSFELQQKIETAKKLIPTSFGDYDIIRVNKKGDDVSFLKSPDWDVADEPCVGDSIKIESGKSPIFRRGRTKNPQIYHHKWMFVTDDYQGFSVGESKQRSEWWENAGLDFEKNRIGNQEYWNENVVSKLNKINLSISDREVLPSSHQWQRGPHYEEIKHMYPSLFEAQTEEDYKPHPTQRSITVKTYQSLFQYLKAKGFNGTILDASSGLGLGTREGRKMGFTVDDVEPFPPLEYHPKYRNYEDIYQPYDVIISNVVLNVVPQDIRDRLVKEMGRLLKEGGQAFIHVRGRVGDVEAAKGKKSVHVKDKPIDWNGEYYINGNYQKGFTNTELQAYIIDVLSTILGDFKVEIMNKKNAGMGSIKVGVIVTRISS